jgi:uncharacterized protein (TIGR02217 family)
MAEFVDIYLPEKVRGVGFFASPRFKTTIQVNAGGGERANQEWEHPLHKFFTPEGVREWSVVQELKDHWLITAGPFKHFPLRDPMDFASCALVRPNTAPTVSMTDQHIGFGDGFTDSYQLVKTYSRGGETYTRNITLPVLSTVLVAIDGVLVDDADYTVSRPGGVISFDVPPEDGVTITAGFLFDCRVRFENDEVFEGIMRAIKQAGFAELTFIEAKPC